MGKRKTAFTSYFILKSGLDLKEEQAQIVVIYGMPKGLKSIEVSTYNI